MRRILLLLIVPLLLSSIAFAEDVTPRRDLVDFNGSRLLNTLFETELTDGSPTATITIRTDLVVDLVIDIVSDKGGSLVITPLPDDDDLLVLGEASTPLVIADLGETRRAIYTKISAPNSKIVFTKTEAGTTSGFLLSVRGLGR